MSLSKIFLFVLPFALLSCAAKSHKLEEPARKTENGSTLVKIKLHKKEVAQVGTPIEAFAQDCKSWVNAKGLSRKSCNPRLVGSGKVTQLVGDSAYQVEFDQAIPIEETTEFEIQK